jgi:hypothetical protein
MPPAVPPRRGSVAHGHRALLNIIAAGRAAPRQMDAYSASAGGQGKDTGAAATAATVTSGSAGDASSAWTAAAADRGTEPSPIPGTTR